MSPFQHGEVFVTDDGAETDLDLGHYERFTNASVTRSHNVTTGQIYDSIISRERRGDYLGAHRAGDPARHRRDQEAHPLALARRPRPTCIIAEIGGTVGDIESLPFLEAIRQLRLEHRPRNVLFVHLTLVPYIKAAGELKTKPTQHSVKELREIGIQPDILICRSEIALDAEVREKIALFCNVPTEARDRGDGRAARIYEVPLNLRAAGLDELIVERLGLPDARAAADLRRLGRHASTA